MKQLNVEYVLRNFVKRQRSFVDHLLLRYWTSQMCRHGHSWSFAKQDIKVHYL